MTSRPATPAELARARREGRGPLSELAVFAATWTAVGVTAPALVVALRAAVREALAQAARPEVEPVRAASAITARTISPLGVALAAAVVAATAATLAQTRGARRASTGRSGEPGAWATAVTTTAYGAVVLASGAVALLRGGSPARFAALLGAVVALLAAVDLAWRAWRWRRALATTAEERRRAQRDDEGDPAVRRERARRMR